MNNIKIIEKLKLPKFSNINVKNFINEIKQLIINYQNIIKEVLNEPNEHNWENFCQKLDCSENELNKTWSLISHLNGVKNNQEIRTVYEKCLLLISKHNILINQNKKLYNAYRNLKKKKCYIEFNIAQKKSIDNILINFELSGITLTTNKQKRYGQIITRLSELSSKYSNNVLDATKYWNKLITNKNDLSGTPENIINAAQNLAKKNKKNGWLITLDITSYLPIMMYCNNHLLRKELYNAYYARASNKKIKNSKWNNEPIINEILTLRYELAQLLGFKSYAHKALTTTMAKSPETVLNFLNNLIKKIKKQVNKEIVQLKSFAKIYFNHHTLNPWDIAYYSERQKEHIFSINNEKLRSYFPEDQVLCSIINIIKHIYEILIKETKKIDTWHKDVRFFSIYNKNNELLGGVYLDLYARMNKQKGAWMDSYTSKMRNLDGTLQKPVAYIVCNFNNPINGEPALFNHNEITTLFHEFGHALQHILTSIDVLNVSGINGIPWDAIEIPSQFMENYCFQKESLLLMAYHYKTGHTLSDNLLQNILKTKNYQIAIFILRQLVLGLFDLFIHYNNYSENKINIKEIIKKIKIKLPINSNKICNFSPYTFTHIFSGGYAAKYYSYLWSNTIALDIWSQFEKHGIFNSKIGKKFLDIILSQGGTEEPINLFIRFQGRNLNTDAMLLHYGIIKK